LRFALCPLPPDIERILIPEDVLQARVGELAAQISADYAGQELVLVCVLRGALIFAADLLRRLAVPARIDFMAISSYGEETQSSGVVRINKDLDDSIEGRPVLVVEDIIDTGLTLQYLLEILQRRNPASLRVCALLEKPARRAVPVRADYVGFSIPDAFVVGYGLDYAQRYRGLPCIATLKPEVYR
jgi:hypoxanthine phosphoribosyltransferase